MRCIAADQDLVDGLGAAFQMLKIQGNPPSEVLLMLDEGPATHVHKQLFRYRMLIDRERYGIQRIKDVKKGFAGLISGAIVAAMIGVANTLFPICLLYTSPSPRDS